MSDTDHQSTVRGAFDQWAGHWSGHYGSGGRMQYRISQFADALAKHVRPGGDVLDFGCGTGEIALALASRGWHVSGCDCSNAMLEGARRNDTRSQIGWSLAPPGQPLPFADRSFDAVTGSSVLEYLADPGPVLGEFARVLRPGGVVLATVPDPAHPIRRRESLKIPFARFTPTWALLRATRWANDFTYLRLSVTRPPLAEWRPMFEAAGFASPELPRSGAEPLVLLAAERAR